MSEADRRRINLNNLNFITSATKPEEFISTELPQVVFAGRSNVGKSSVINRLANRKKLAFVGATPGKTVHVNYFDADGKQTWVDLPGYGYAKVSKTEKERWGELMEDYFGSPGRIDLGILIVDARHAPTDDDRIMYEWFRGTGVPCVIVANKCDKLKKSEYEPNLRLIRDKLLPCAETPIVMFSATRGDGCGRLIDLLNELQKPEAGTDE